MEEPPAYAAVSYEEVSFWAEIWIVTRNEPGQGWGVGLSTPFQAKENMGKTPKV